MYRYICILCVHACARVCVERVCGVRVHSLFRAPWCLLIIVSMCVWAWVAGGGARVRSACAHSLFRAPWCLLICLCVYGQGGRGAGGGGGEGGPRARGQGGGGECVCVSAPFKLAQGKQLISARSPPELPSCHAIRTRARSAVQPRAGPSCCYARTCDVPGRRARKT
jgi:hypothetical protein